MPRLIPILLGGCLIASICGCASLDQQNETSKGIDGLRRDIGVLGNNVQYLSRYNDQQDAWINDIDRRINNIEQKLSELEKHMFEISKKADRVCFTDQAGTVVITPCY